MGLLQHYSGSFHFSIATFRLTYMHVVLPAPTQENDIVIRFDLSRLDAGLLGFLLGNFDGEIHEVVFI